LSRAATLAWGAGTSMSPMFCVCWQRRLPAAAGSTCIGRWVNSGVAPDTRDVYGDGNVVNLTPSTLTATLDSQTARLQPGCAFPSSSTWAPTSYQGTPFPVSLRHPTEAVAVTILDFLACSSTG